MRLWTLYTLAALAEIAGCFAFWVWLRQQASSLWLVPGMAALAAFALLLAFVPVSAAGRAFAAYGGIYIVASLGWLWAVERVLPDRWDVLGGLFCILGSVIILSRPGLESRSPLAYARAFVESPGR